MTRIDFFQIDSKEPAMAFACRLVEKAYRQGHKIYVHTESAAHSSELDDLLWTYRGEKFIPHALQSAGTEAPIHIGNSDNPGEHQDVLVNLSSEVPPFFSRFSRVAELVDGDATRMDAARERYRYYKDRGYTLNTHNL